MRVGGILETALYVTDVKRSAEFYRRLFGFPTLLESERLIALDVVGKGVLLLFPEGGTNEPFPVPGGGGVIPPHGGSPGDTISRSRSAPRTSRHGRAASNPRAWPSRAS